MKIYAFYDPSGEVRNVTTLHENVTDPLAAHPPGRLMLELNELRNPWDIYVSNNEILDRPEMGITVSATTVLANEVIRIDNIPVGTSVRYPDGTIVVNDGFIEWDSAIPGDYMFILDNFPYKREVVHAKVE